MHREKIQEIITTTLTHMNVAYESVEVVDSPESSHLRFSVRTADSPLLIGAKGENLAAFNYVVRRLVAKTLGEETPVKFFIDVNDYHEKALEGIKTKATIMSERARSFKVNVELEPMSSYDRMLVHSFLENAKDIKTESVGEGVERRVVIKYVAS